MSTIQLTLHLLWAAFMATIGFFVELTPPGGNIRGFRRHG